MVSVEPVDDVPDPDRGSPVETRHEMDHAQLGERIARFRDGRWLEVGRWEVRDVVEAQHQGGVEWVEIARG